MDPGATLKAENETLKSESTRLNGLLVQAAKTPSIDRDLATERDASWLSKHFTYWWLEENGHGRVFIDADGL